MLWKIIRKLSAYLKITFATLFDYELRALNRAETRLATSLPWMSKTAIHPELRTCLTDRGSHCASNIASIIKTQRACRYVPPWRERELSEILTADGDGAIDCLASWLVIDLALIADARRISHYLLARYQSAAILAGKLGDRDAEKTLKGILSFERKYENNLDRNWRAIVRRASRELVS